MRLRLLACLIALLPTAAFAVSFAPGDILFAGIPFTYLGVRFSAFIDRYDATGFFQEPVPIVLWSAPLDAISLGRDVILGGESALTVIHRDGSATKLGDAQDAGALAVSAIGDLYVAERSSIRLVPLSGGTARQFTVPSENPYVSAMDLQRDQCTMLYGSDGPTVQRYDICTSTALPAFARLSSGDVYSIRVLLDGDVLVGTSKGMIRFDSSGQIRQSYAPALNIARITVVPGEQSVWVATPALAKIDLSSGAIVGPLPEPRYRASWHPALIVIGDQRASQTPLPSAIPTLSWLPSLLVIGTLIVLGAYRLGGQ